MAVEQLNDELRQKLGTKPLYGWKWGGDLYFVAAKTHADGSPKFEMTALQGADGKPTGLLGVQVDNEKIFFADHYERVKPGVKFSQRWVFCRLQQCLLTYQEWRETMGSMVPYVREMWVPVDISGKGMGVVLCGHLMTEPHQPITRFLQERAINLILMNKRFLEKLNSRQLHDAMYDETEEREKRIEQNALMAKDAMPVGGLGHIPGEKDFISFPSTKRTN